MSKVLLIGGVDNSCGAGIAADIRAIEAAEAQCCCCVTALTAQSDQAVYAVEHISKDFFRQQVGAVIETASIIKTGALFSFDIASCVIDVVKRTKLPLIVDPVIAATSGKKLVDEQTQKLLVSEIVAMAYLVTPNIPEAEIIADMKISNQADIKTAATRILQLGAQNVLIKGGHLIQGDSVSDILYSKQAEEIFSSPLVKGKNVRGTGCMMASYIAGRLTKSSNLKDAISDARGYIASLYKIA